VFTNSFEFDNSTYFPTTFCIGKALKKNGTVHVLPKKNTAMNAIKEKMIWVLYFMLIATLVFVGTI